MNPLNKIRNTSVVETGEGLISLGRIWVLSEVKVLNDELVRSESV